MVAPAPVSLTAPLPRFFVCGSAAVVAAARAGDVVSVAVSAEGRRAVDHVVVDDALVAAWPAGVVACLDHAGPLAALWSTERPVGPGLVAESITGRVPRVVDDAAVAALVAAYARAAAAFAARGVDVAVGAFVDNFCHACCSPLMCRPPRPDVVAAIVAACAAACGAVDVVVVVDDLAPGGVDATAGRALCASLCAPLGAGARRVIATVGTVRLLPLLARDKGDATDVDGLFVDAVAFAAGGAAVWAAGVADAVADARLRQRANTLKLQGIMRMALPAALANAAEADVGDTERLSGVDNGGNTRGSRRRSP